jgi:hypothetical protein
MGRTSVWGPLAGAHSHRWSRRDYEIFAKIVRDARKELRTLDGGLKDEAHDEGVNAVVWQMCKVFKADNPLFEELKFVGACSESI